MLNKLLFMSIAVSLQFVAFDALAQSDTKTANSRFVLKLNDNHVASLKSLGTIQSRELESEIVGKISAIQLQFSGASTDQAVITEANVSVTGNACQIQLNDAVIDLARQQPIRINVPIGSVFSRVFLKYPVSSRKPPASTTPALNSQGSAGMNTNNAGNANNNGFFQHYVKLAENKTLGGQMDLSESIKFNTKFGEIDVSVGQIRGIRFHIDGDDSALVVLNNGDSITGVPLADSFTLNTDWGRAELDAVFIESITTSQNATFRQSNDPGFGPRWQLYGN